ncbi:MAG: hypothetical protein KDA41_12800, partial [Planctomycetales bacterium]|nr:hypothetical protein [Planctomycetales bacterium]
VVSDRLSPNHYLQDAYKLVPSDDKLLLAEAPPLYAHPINAAICTPSTGHAAAAGEVTVSGYALPTGVDGAVIARVEVTIDGGRSWKAAKFLDPAQPFCWRRWQATVKVDPTVRQITVRATDSSGRVQPKTSPWNMKGYMYNPWHTIEVKVQS